MSTGETRARPRWHAYARWGAISVAAVVVLFFLFLLFGAKAYRIPSPTMEPTLHCAQPSYGCLGEADDRVLVCTICQTLSDPSRGDVMVFHTPASAVRTCGGGGTFVKRVIGLPGETVREDSKGFIWIFGPHSRTGTRLEEPYVSARSRQFDSAHFDQTWHVPKGDYFMVGDNRSRSCDSRQWGGLPAAKLIGPVIFRYWPWSRIGFP